MTFLSSFAAAAVLAGTAAVAASGAAQAGPRDLPRGWDGPEGHFIVYARACPDLREDFRDRRRDTGYYDRREDRRDRRVLDCPRRAFDYVPSRREARFGLTGERLRPQRAYYSRRHGQYFVETRWNAVPVYIVRGRPHRYGHRYGYRYDYGREAWRGHWR